MEKKNYNKTAIFCIQMLKDYGLINDWKKGASIYLQLVGTEISPTTLSRQAGEVLVTKDVDTQLLKEFVKTARKLTSLSTDVEVKEVEETKQSKFPAAVINTFAIKKEDLMTKFDIDIENDSEDVIAYKLRQKIANKAFILSYMNYDPGLFDIIYEIGYWTTPVKIKQKNGTDRVEVILNNKAGIKIIERKVTFDHFTYEEYSQYLDRYLSERAITMYDLFEQKMENTPLNNTDLAIVCPGMELHLGKQGAASDHEDYSTKHAMARIRMLAQTILQYQDQVRASKLIMGVGNDYLNTDTINEKTGAETPQQNDTRPKELTLWGKIGYLSLIDSIKDSFDKVILKYNPGNHDELSSWQLYDKLYERYADTAGSGKVEVGMTFKDMHFTTGYMHGDYLLVFSHGKASETKALSNDAIVAMAIESFPEEYARARHMYVFTGHTHTDTEQVFGKLRSTILRTASLSGHGSWDAKSGYTTSRQGHTIYQIDAKLGYIGKQYLTLSNEDRLQKIPSFKRNFDVDINQQMTSVLNLTNRTAKLDILAKKESHLDKFLKETSNKIIEDAKQALVTVNVNFDDLEEEKRREFLEKFGYDSAIEPIEKHKSHIKRLIEKHGVKHEKS
jgi:hypothetical protein